MNLRDSIDTAILMVAEEGLYLELIELTIKQYREFRKIAWEAHMCENIEYLNFKYCGILVGTLYAFLDTRTDSRTDNFSILSPMTWVGNSDDSKIAEKLDTRCNIYSLEFVPLKEIEGMTMIKCGECWKAMLSYLSHDRNEYTFNLLHREDIQKQRDELDIVKKSDIPITPRKL